MPTTKWLLALTIGDANPTSRYRSGVESSARYDAPSNLHNKHCAIKYDLVRKTASPANRVIMSTSSRRARSRECQTSSERS
jgi:hypothetical protein